MTSGTHLTRTPTSGVAGSRPCATASSYSRLACSIDLATVAAVTFGAAVDRVDATLACLSSRTGASPPNIPPEVRLGGLTWEEMAQAV